VPFIGGQQAFTAYPGDNGKILYQAADPNTFEPEIWVMNSDDTGHTNITNTPNDADVEGVWSPDGTKIAFVSNREGGNFDIWLMDADGGNPTPLTDDAGGDSNPTWSPDGTKIAFGANRDGDSDIWVMNADGTNETNVSNTAVGEGEPSWSPDGTKIAYTYVPPSPGTCYQEIYVMDANGANQTPLTCQIQARTPDWSPDGTKIAFAVGIGTGVSIWVMNADGSGEDEIAVSSAFDPTWSPDGAKVLFDAVRPAGIGLFTVNPDGTGEALLADNGGANGYWQPVLPPPGDEDGDGVPDDSDNCPKVANAAGQGDDVDGDMAGDACDAPGSGNVDCSGPVSGVNAVDALWVLRWGAGLSVAQSEPCLDIGTARALAPPDDWKLGDTNCSGLVNSVDALLILRANAGLSTNIPGGCPAIKPA
jgi:Tol biopolymer transport system component